MLLFIPSIVINAVLVALAVYAMWTRGVDLRTSTVPHGEANPRQLTREETLAA